MSKNTYPQHAIYEGDLTTLKEWIEAGGDIHQKDDNGWLPITWAVYHNQLHIVAYLAKHGADLNNALQAAHKYDKAYLIDFLELEIHLQNTPEWSLIGSSKIAHAEISEPLSLRLTEIFNFSSCERTLITENLKTKTKSVTPPVQFRDLPAGHLQDAFNHFKDLGGEADENLVLRDKVTLDKQTVSLTQ